MIGVVVLAAGAGRRFSGEHHKLHTEVGGRPLYRWAVAAAVEAALMITVLINIDFADPLHRLVFLLAMLTYFTLGLAIVALGAHVSRVQERMLAALELLRNEKR